MQSISLPPAHPLVSIPTNEVIFLDIQNKNIPLDFQKSSSNRIIIELNTHVYPKFTQHLVKLVTGSIIQNMKPCGFKSIEITTISPSTGILLAGYGPGFHLDYHHATEYPQIQSIQNAPTVTQYSLILPLDKIALGNNYQFRIITQNIDEKNPYNPISPAEIVIGRVLTGVDAVQHIITAPISETDKTPRQPITVQQCGQF